MFCFDHQTPNCRTLSITIRHVLLKILTLKTIAHSLNNLRANKTHDVNLLFSALQQRFRIHIVFVSPEWIFARVVKQELVEVSFISIVNYHC